MDILQKQIEKLNDKVSKGISSSAKVCTNIIKNGKLMKSTCNELISSPSKIFHSDKNTASIFATCKPSSLPRKMATLRNSFREAYPTLPSIETILDQVRKGPNLGSQSFGRPAVSFDFPAALGNRQNPASFECVRNDDAGLQPR